MKGARIGLAVGITLASAAYAQSPAPNPANNPDKVSWELFVRVNRPAVPGGDNTAFETWASNEDTFKTNPQFPGATSTPSCALPQMAGRALAPVAQSLITPVASPKILHVPALRAEALSVPTAPAAPNTRDLARVTSAAAAPSEEVRRNQATFDFIYCNKLFTRAGLRNAFASGQPIAFPRDSIEVKANWIPAGDRSPTAFHINTAADGKRYALISMHVISKEVPNWTWATFEHQDNPGRCDTIGCHDSFGAASADVLPNANPGGQYGSCVKSAALKQLFADAGMPALWDNYCLKGSQVDYVAATGAPTRLGNSVTEDGFVATSSCLTCHARASVNAAGRNIYGGGFIRSSDPAICPDGSQQPCSPSGTPNPAWFWSNPDQPNRSMLALQTDFVWSLARSAIGP